MTMLLALDVILAVGLVIFALVGARRGPWPEVVTLAGLLLGSLLVDEWGDPWGTDLSSLFSFLGTGGGRLIVRGLLFLIPLLAIGYGGALLLPPHGRWSGRVRLAAAGLALFNGAAIFAELLRIWDYSQPGPGSALRDDPVTLALLQWAGWWPIVLAAGGIIAVLVAGLTRPRGAGAPAPAPTPAPRPVSSPTGTAVYPPPPASGAPALASRPGGDGTATPPPAPSPLPSRPAAPPTRPVETVAATPGPAAGTSGEERCRTCNQVLKPGAAFCPNCGTPV